MVLGARKFIEKKSFTKEGKDYETYTYEVIDTDLTNADFDLLYETVMEAEDECAHENGLYSDDGGFHSLDVEKVSERIEEFIDDYNVIYEEDFENPFEENHADAPEILRIQKILKYLPSCTVYYNYKKVKGED